VNFDYRSFYLSFECGVWMYNTDTVFEVLADYNSLISQSIRISLEDCRVSFIKRVVRALVAAFAPLF
jgi:cardiolipin synthase